MSAKYLLCYVCAPLYPAQGSIFPSIFTRLCWSLFTFQVVLFGVLGGRNFLGAIGVVPLAIAQLLFWLWTDRQFHSGAKFGSLDGDAASVYSREEEHMKKTVESRLAVPLLAEENDNNMEQQLQLNRLLPHSDTYLFVPHRKPLFQIEDQNPLLPSLLAGQAFYPTIWELSEQPTMEVATSWKNARPIVHYRQPRHNPNTL